MMAANRKVLTSAQPRMAIKNKSSINSKNFQKPPKLSAMSPEARKAMVMVISREDTKENMSSCPKLSSIERPDDSRKTPASRSASKGRHPPRPHNDTATAPPQRSANLQTTARSRSTLSHHEAPRSASDRSSRIKDAYNNNISKQYKPNIAGSSLSNNNNSNASMMENINDIYDDHAASALDYELEAADLQGKGDNVNDTDVLSDEGERNQSFVMTLDKALEDHGLSRLRGDITDKTPISQTRVRALDGGRLTNAQEVVVNVCYEDDRELVFHDDDEESLDTARAASLIRVNVWMDYNDNFTSDDSPDDHDSSEDVELQQEATPTSHERVNQNLRSRNINQAKIERTKTFLQPQKETMPRMRCPLPKLPNISSSNSKDNTRTQMKNNHLSPIRAGSSLSNNSRKNSASLPRQAKKL